eukprot:scaffold40300_cov270-Isochrysis_galbana.AAC.7
MRHAESLAVKLGESSKREEVRNRPIRRDRAGAAAWGRVSPFAVRTASRMPRAVASLPDPLPCVVLAWLHKR